MYFRDPYLYNYIHHLRKKTSYVREYFKFILFIDTAMEANASGYIPANLHATIPMDWGGGHTG